MHAPPASRMAFLLMPGGCSRKHSDHSRQKRRALVHDGRAAQSGRGYSRCWRIAAASSAGYYDATDADALTRLLADVSHLLREQPE